MTLDSRTRRPRKARHAASILAGALLCGAGAAHAQTYGTTVVAPYLTPVDTFTTTTTTASPTYNRVAIAQGLNTYTGALGSNPPGLSGLGTAVAYDASNTFSPSLSSTYVVNTSATGYDPGTFVQYLYTATTTAFSPASPTSRVKYGYYAGTADNSGSYSFTTGTAALKYQVVNAGYYNANDTTAGHNSVGTATTTISLYNAGTTKAIPDNNATTGATQALTVTDTTIINSFNSITIDGLNHPFLGDLVATLSHNGVSVDLFDHVGANNDSTSPGYNYGQGSAASFDGNNYTFSLTGADLSAVPDFTSAPDGTTYMASGNAAGGYDTANAANTLNSFVGQSVAGAWTLTLKDEQLDDTGSFTGFSFNINNPAAAPEPSQWAALAVGALGIGGLMLRARRRRSEA